MLRIHLAGLSIFVSLFAILYGGNVFAEESTTTVVEKRVVITPAPKSASCTTVSAHWEGSMWIDEQTVCKYENRPEGLAWVRDYWVCTVTTADGSCTTWEYKPGHWIKTLP